MKRDCPSPYKGGQSFMSGELVRTSLVRNLLSNFTLVAAPYLSHSAMTNILDV